MTQLLTVHVTTKKVKRAKSFKVHSCFALLSYLVYITLNPILSFILLTSSISVLLATFTNVRFINSPRCSSHAVAIRPFGGTAKTRLENTAVSLIFFINCPSLPIFVANAFIAQQFVCFDTWIILLMSVII